jgi:YD repeat-containing protein
MKRIGVWLCAVLLLLSMAACGQKQEDTAYPQGLVELNSGNYAKAYTYFLESDDPRAAEELTRLVFVPLRQTSASSFKPEQNVLAYSYDARGNLLREDSVFEGTETVTEYTYNEQNWLMKVKSNDSTTTYTYDEAGKRLTYVHEHITAGVYREEYEYDGQGNLVKTHVTMADGTKQTVFPQEEPDVEGVSGECVYDNAGRLLSETYENGEKFEFTYDEYGNKITERYTWNDTVIEYRYEWELKYYPDGMSEPVKAERERAMSRRPVA